MSLVYAQKSDLCQLSPKYRHKQHMSQRTEKRADSALDNGGISNIWRVLSNGRPIGRDGVPRIKRGKTEGR